MKKSFLRTIKQAITRRPWVDWVALGGALIVFGVLSFVNISSASIWFDEAFSAYIVRFNLAEITSFTATDVHPPLYYWLLKIWTELFGTTEAAFRSLSVLFGGGALVVAFLLARRYFGRLVSGVSLVFLALSPTLIRYSDEARMYTLATLIVLLATYVLTKAVASTGKKWWILYGVLVSLGMWTHYFTAIVWLSHWVWRAIEVRKGGKKIKFFSKEWVLSHVIAVGLYLPWIPSFLTQIKAVQSGFWISPVSLSTPINYITNFFYYLEQNQVVSWLALITIVAIGTAGVFAARTYKQLTGVARSRFVLIASISFAAPVILFVLSMPPLSPVFVERYFVPSMVTMSIFFAVIIVVATRSWQPVYRVIPVVVIAAMMTFGVFNVYHYGNYNKNTNIHIQARELVDLIKQKAPVGTPIIADSPWTYYEMAFYSTPEYPIYFIDDAVTYEYGSLDMLLKSDIGKIKDIHEFSKHHAVIWYAGFNDTKEDTPIDPYDSSWEMQQTVSTYSELMGRHPFRAAEYRISAE